MSSIDVEKEFTAFVRSFGGKVLEDEHGTTLPFANADFVFAEWNVVAELKRLVDDKATDQATQDKIQRKFEAWMETGVIPPAYGLVTINSRTLPERCQRELLDLFRPALRKRLLKANKQIKQTAEQLGMPAAQGLVFVVNDGNDALEAEVALYLIYKVLGSDCRSIHSVVYITVNMPATSLLSSGPVTIWTHFSRISMLPAVDEGFVESLLQGWRSHLERLTGQRIGRIPGHHSQLESVRFLKDH